MWPRWALRPRDALQALGALRSLETLRARSACFTLRSLGARGAARARGALWPLRACGALRTDLAGVTSVTLFTSLALWSLRAGIACQTDWARGARIAPVAFFTSRTLGAWRAYIALWAL